MRKRNGLPLNSERVEEIIRSRGLKKAWISDEMGVDPSTLSRVLAARKCRLSTLKALAKILGVQMEDIAA